MCTPNSGALVPQRLAGGNGTKTNFFNPSKINNRDLEGVIEGPLLITQKTVKKPQQPIVNFPPPKTPNAAIQQLVQRLHNPIPYIPSYMQFLSQNSTEKSTFGDIDLQ